MIKPLGYIRRYEKRKLEDGESFADAFWHDLLDVKSIMIAHKFPYYTKEQLLKIKELEEKRSEEKDLDKELKICEETEAYLKSIKPPKKDSDE